jgi:hypothetical protein
MSQNIKYFNEIIRNKYFFRIMVLFEFVSVKP